MDASLYKMEEFDLGEFKQSGPDIAVVTDSKGAWIICYTLVNKHRVDAHLQKHCVSYIDEIFRQSGHARAANYVTADARRVLEIMASLKLNREIENGTKSNKPKTRRNRSDGF